MRTISRSQYQQLLGLLALVQQHNQALNEIKQALISLLGPEEDTDWIGEAVYGEADEQRLLQRLSITVEPPGEQVPPGMVEVRPGTYQRTDE